MRRRHRARLAKPVRRVVPRLAVIQGSPGQGSGPQTAGFLTLPAGTFEAAAGAPPDAQGYDAVLRRWIPAGVEALTPDGLHYVYAEHSGLVSTFHVVDLRTNSDHVIGSSGQWVGAGLDKSALYAMRVEFTDSTAYGRMEISKGLWSIPLDGGEPAQLTTDSRHWAWAHAGGVYGDYSTGDVAGAPNDVVRFDVEKRQTVKWFDPHARTRLLAVDVKGAAFVETETSDEELWRVSGPGDAVKVWSGSPEETRPGGPVAVDGSDIWFSSSSMTRSWTIFHYSSHAGMRQVATFTDRPMTVAGPCG